MSRFPIIINEPIFDLPEWEEDIDVSEFQDEKPTREHKVVHIPPEAYRSDALINTGAGVYYIHNRGKK